MVMFFPVVVEFCRVCYKLGKDLQVGLTEQEKAELNKLTVDELLEIIDREQGVKDFSPLQSVSVQDLTGYQHTL